MAYTLQDAIKGMVDYHDSRINPLHAKTFNEVCKIWADTLRTAPTDMRLLNLEIGIQQRRLNKQSEASEKWKIAVAIDALEWVKGRIICKDFEMWVKPPKRP
jgi:hypothetical protein